MSPVADVPIADIVAVVFEQIPEQIRNRVSVRVEGDAYRLRGMAFVKTEQGNEYRCELELRDVGWQRQIACGVPEVFIAHLCVVVV